MDRIVLLIDTAKASAYEAAEWFIKKGDTVYIGAKRRMDYPDGCTSLEFDPFCEESLEAAVKAIEEKHGKLDILILGTIKDKSDGVIGTGHDDETMLDTIMLNSYANIKIIEAFEPLLRKGMKRIAGITDIESSNTYCTTDDDIGYHASAAAFNMMGRVMYNHLRPDGFTFRWYCDDGIDGGMCAAEYIASALCYDPKEPYTHSDENRMVLRDAYMREMSW